MGATPSSPTVSGATATTSEGSGDAEAADALERASNGDREAIMWLYDRYAPSLMAIAVRVTGSTAEAEEVLQDAMTRAWIEARSYDRNRGSALAWLVTLTRNRAIDVVRARGRRGAYQEIANEDARSIYEQPATPEHTVSEAERAAAVRLALRSLTEAQRQALDLAYFAGMSHSEIAKELGQPLGTVKTHIAQAVRRLRDELARFSPRPPQQS